MLRVRTFIFQFIFVFLDFLSYFSLFFLSLPQLLSCLCVYLFLNEAWCFDGVLGRELITVKVTAWYKRESIIDVSENWASDFLSLISEKYHVLPFNSSTSHFVDNSNILPFWLGYKINNREKKLSWIVSGHFSIQSGWPSLSVSVTGQHYHCSVAMNVFWVKRHESSMFGRFAIITFPFHSYRKGGKFNVITERRDLFSNQLSWVITLKNKREEGG